MTRPAPRPDTAAAASSASCASIPVRAARNLKSRIGAVPPHPTARSPARTSAQSHLRLAPVRRDSGLRLSTLRAPAASPRPPPACTRSREEPRSRSAHRAILPTRQTFARPGLQSDQRSSSRCRPRVAAANPLRPPHGCAAARSRAPRNRRTTARPGSRDSRPRPSWHRALRPRVAQARIPW